MHSESRALLDACKTATAVRKSGSDAAFAAMENALANAVTEHFAIMRKWRAMELAETDQAIKGALEEYNQTLGAMEREAKKALEHVQAVRRIAAQFDALDLRMQEKFKV